MADKKSTSRIIDEMSETMRGLHRCGVLTQEELEKFIRSAEKQAKQAKHCDEIKSQ